MWAKQDDTVAVEGEPAPMGLTNNTFHPLKTSTSPDRPDGLQRTDVGSLLMLGLTSHRLTSGYWFSLLQTLEGSTCRLFFSHCVYSIAKQSEYVQERTKQPLALVNFTLSFAINGFS